MKLLFVCSRNRWRSPTGEAIYKSSPIHSAKSAGTEPSAKNRISAKDILWADIVFVMEKRHKQRIAERFPRESANKNIVILHIEDDYQYMDQELVDMITSSVDPYL